MQCKRCGAENSEGKKFCTQCGEAIDVEQISEAVVVPSEVVCSGCGQIIKEGIKFCNHCGMQQTNQVVPVPLAEVDTHVSDKQSRVGTMLLKGKQLLTNKNIKVGLIAVGAVLVIGGIGSCLIANGEGITKDEALLVCTDEDYEKYIVTGNDNVHEIGEADGKVCVSRDLEHIYYTQLDKEELYYLDINKEIQEIDEDLLGYTLSITPDGKSAIYLKDAETNEDDYSVQGTLMYLKGSEVIEVEEEVSDAYISENGTYIAYQIEDEVFRSNKGEEEEALDIQSILGVANDGSVLGFDEEELILETTKEAKVLGEDIYEVLCSSDLKQIYFIDEDNELYGYDGKVMQEIAEDVYYMESLYDEGGLFEIGYVTEDEEVFIVKSLDKHYELKEDQMGIQHYYHPEDEVMYYLEDGEDLHVATYGESKVEDDRIAKDVTYTALASTRDKGVYLEDETLYAFEGTKEPKQMAEDIEDVKQLVVADAGYVWYLDTDNILYYINKKGEVEEIAEDISEITRAIEESIYLLNEDNEVLKVTKDKVGDEVIVEDIISLQVITVDNTFIY